MACECELSGWCKRHGINKNPHLVHLCQTNDSYFKAWEEGRGPLQKRTDKPQKIHKPDPVCIHRGDIMGTADCGCSGKPKVYQCDLHGFAMDRKLKPGRVPVVMEYSKQSVDMRYCNGCADFARHRAIYPAIETRNLIYHVYPRGDWLDAVKEIAAHIDVFNGRRIVAIATDTDMDVDAIWDEVMVALHPHVLFTTPNDPKLRETVTFRPLIESVLNDSPSEATFYAHTKGNTTADGFAGALRWRQTMVANLLGRWDDAMGHLRAFSFVGTHKMIWPTKAVPPFPTRIKPTHSWMHAGTFWWFRHDCVGKAYRSDLVANDRYGVEAFPAQLIPHEQAYSMWQPWAENESAWPQSNPYDPAIYEIDHSQ